MHTCKKKRAPVLRALGPNLACRAPFMCKLNTYHVCNIQIKFVPPIIFVIHHILHTCKKKRAPVLRALGLSLACRAPFLCKLKNSDRADVLC